VNVKRTVEGRFGKLKASKGEILLLFLLCMVSLKGSYIWNYKEKKFVIVKIEWIATHFFPLVKVTRIFDAKIFLMITTN